MSKVKVNKLVSETCKKNLKSKSNKDGLEDLMYHLPDINSSNPQERKGAIWLNEMRKAKAGLPSKLIWFSILDEDAKEYGYPDIFDKKYIINYKTKGNKNGKH